MKFLYLLMVILSTGIGIASMIFIALGIVHSVIYIGDHLDTTLRGI